MCPTVCRVLNLLEVRESTPSVKIGWGDSLERLYSTQEDRMDLANDLFGIVLEIDGDRKRNMKIWLIEKLLDRNDDSDDGFWIIWLINQLSFEFRNEQFKGRSRALDLLLQEWTAQAQEELHHDTLYYVLCMRGESRAKRRAALLMQCRRVRSLSWSNNRLSRISLSILESAEPPAEESDGENTEFLSFVPANQWKLAWKLQKLFCVSRFSDMGFVLDLAEELEAELENAGLEIYSHRPDLNLKWWIYQVKQRVASVCMERDEFEKTSEMLRRIEEEAQEGASSLASHLKEVRSRSDPGATSAESQSPASRARIEVVKEFLDSWLDFLSNEKGALDIRNNPRGLRNRQLEEQEVAVRMSIGKFSDNLQRFNQHIHVIHEHSPTNRPTFLKHALSVNSDQQRIRSGKLLGEISHARNSVSLFNSNLSCVMLEILHRLLIYRLWWESCNYRGEKTCFKLEHAEEIVNDIKTDLLKIYPLSSYKKGLTVSFRPTKDMFEKMHEFPTDHARINGLLRERIDKFQKHGDEYWNETHRDSHILGIPILPPGKSPYDVVDTLRSYVGTRRPEDVHVERSGIQ